MENELNQLLALLGGEEGKAAAVVAWMGTARVFAKVFSGYLQAAAERAIARVTGTEDTEDDAIVAAIIRSKPYRFTAFLVDWALSIKLPLKLEPPK